MKKFKSIVATLLTCVTIVGMVGSVSGFDYTKTYFQNATIRHGESSVYMGSGGTFRVSESRDFPLTLKKSSIGRAGDFEMGVKKVVGSSYYNVGAYDNVTVSYSDVYNYYRVYPELTTGVNYLPYLSPSNGLILTIEYVKMYYN